jgi:pilus assembly protein Flp/PilA
MLRSITRFLRDEEGATAIEYGIIAGLISVVIVGVLTDIGGQLAVLFGKIKTSLTSAGTAPSAPL